MFNKSICCLTFAAPCKIVNVHVSYECILATKTSVAVSRSAMQVCKAGQTPWVGKPNEKCVLKTVMDVFTAVLFNTLSVSSGPRDLGKELLSRKTLQDLGNVK